MTRTRRGLTAGDTAHGAATTTRAGASGLEVFRRLAAGELPAPPLVRLLGFRLTEVAKGRVVFVATPTEAHYNGMGVVHGGWSAALLDSALGCAVNSMMPAGRVFATLELKVNLTRPLRAETGEVRCEAAVLHVGRRTATADARVLDRQGRLYAHATATCIVVEPPQ
ncbi:MAG: PaaI family thioesterase [Vicinamibacterales bacterium]